MQMGEAFVDIMINDGVIISKDEKKKVIEDIQKALDSNRVRFLEKEGHSIGFLTYVPKPDKILINYCFVYKKFRDRSNFFELRKFFRSITNQTYWKSRKKKRLCFVK